MLYRVGDRVEVQTLAQKYRGERGEITGTGDGGELYVKLVGVKKPVPLYANELKLRSSLGRAKEAKQGGS